MSTERPLTCQLRSSAVSGFSWFSMQAIFLHGAILFGLCGCGAGQVKEPVADDEAHKRALSEGISLDHAADAYFYPRKKVDYFKGMDMVSSPDTAHQLIDLQLADGKTPGDVLASSAPGDAKLAEDEFFGRNTWMIWCAGNEGFWDDLTRAELGFIDLLKLLDSRRRSQRFNEAGMINEPGMRAARMIEADEFDLWLDQPNDESLRRWRKAYLKQTFDQIAKGTHKSQRGLAVYRGDAAERPDDYRYDTPDEYLQEMRDGSTSDAAVSGESNANSSEAYATNEGGFEGGESPQQNNDYGTDRIPPPDIYGLSSGVVGLRLFPNPYFTAKARAKWQAARFYDDDSYFRDPKLVRPFRVGMSCAFCHASWHPLNPPSDLTNPQWTNISGNIGAQYLRARATFGNVLPKDNFVYHLLDSQPPGTIDTSLIASDNINNPNAMNPVFRLPERALVSFRNPPEQQSSASARLPSIWGSPGENPPPNAKDPVPEQWRKIFGEYGLSEELKSSNGSDRHVPRVLLDGADSIGAYGSLARVFLNIGSYWERWNQIHQRVLGLTPQEPFALEDCVQHSVYWHATTRRVGPLRDYFLKVSSAMPLLATKGGVERLVIPKAEGVVGTAETSGTIKTQVQIAASDAPATPATIVMPAKITLSARNPVTSIDVTKLKQGRQVFAEQCIVCHSSIQPESSEFAIFGQQPNDNPERKLHRDTYASLAGERLKLRDEWAANGEHWDHDPGQWLQNSEYQKWAAEIVEKPEFWLNNFLSTDYRIPITLLKTNAARAMATNAMSGHMWEDFSSMDYRQLPSPGEIEFFNPYAGEAGGIDTFSPRHKTPAGAPMKGGGPGYYRVPTLVSIWATAPYLHNNSLGLFNNDPSVNGRLEAFDDGMRKLLWPERRRQSTSYNDATAERLKRDHGLIWRTPQETYLVIAAKNVPEIAQRIPFVSGLKDRFPWLDDINPLWLPGAILFLTAWVLLVVSGETRRKSAGNTLLGLAAIAAALFFVASRYPDNRWLTWFSTVRPARLVVFPLIIGGIVLWLPLSKKWVRWTGYLAITVSLLLSGVVYFNSGSLDDLRLGPIPAGTPVNLLANLNSEADPAELKEAIRDTVLGLSEIESRHLSPEEQQRVLREKVAPALLSVNKCPDFVMDKGHYFEWFDQMSDDDKNALIELLKTF